MLDTGELSWAVTATALVLLMTPGLAFFYGGLVKAKSVVSMMMMSFGSIALVGVLWVLYGYSMSAVEDPTDFAGSPFAAFGLDGLDNDGLIGAAFGATFGIITIAIISGAIADRAKFGSWLIFAGLFATFGYFPVAAWVWGGGWVMELGTWLDMPGVIDYAGGTAVHINAGAAALALAIVLGKRFGFAALVVVGDQKGRVGFGKGKAKEVPEAIRKATEQAKRQMIRVPLREGRTLHHDMEGRHGAGKVVMRSAPQGTGIIAGGPMRAVFEMLGLQDVVAKSIGSQNPYNMIRATMNGLQKESSPRMVAQRRGKKVADILNRGDAPAAAAEPAEA